MLSFPMVPSTLHSLNFEALDLGMAALYICKQDSADVFVNTVKEIMSLSAAHSSFIVCYSEG